MTLRRTAVLAVAIAALALFPRAGARAAEAYPNRVIKLVVTFPGATIAAEIPKWAETVRAAGVRLD